MKPAVALKSVCTTRVIIVLLLMLFGGIAHAQAPSRSHSWVIWPSGSVAFPTGRFGEKDEDADPPKDGHKTGYEGGFEAGYFLSEITCVGIGYGYSRFDLDLVGGGRTGHSDVHTVQAWGRFFLPGAYKKWRTYLSLAAGIGRPKGTIEYDPPVAFVGLPSAVTELESTVDVTSSISGGLGVMMPLSGSLAFSVEPRYISVQSAGTGRTDLFTMSDGSQAEVTKDPDGNPVKAKSDINWWEVRFGLVFLIR